ncbi:acyltransferase [Floccifex sp.]|uniref:acyltransferase n=1 Tax=Floccifex sp. TaxID=2815810 RepID=UPI002A748E61|nr:acyltransferase [Floccifex sp.]MDD7282260.1 acyltransferase [Erysipelotrichaceae bacterium]MDY2958208.1 acyltransferase [Floccifex sp.]
MAKKRQYAMIDIAKYVSALLVVAIHTFPFYEISETLNTYFIQTICRIAVPFFFTTSGFFFFRKWSEDKEVNKESVKKYLLRLLKIYLIWSVIYLPYTIYDYTRDGFQIMNIVSYVRDFLLNGSYYHLWFLPALMTATVIVSFLYSKKGLMTTLKVCLILYIFGYFINVYALVWEQIPVISFFYEFFTKVFTTSRNGFFFGPLFVCMGLLLARTKRLDKKLNQIGFLISFILLVLEVTIYRATGILRDLTSMYISLIPAVYFFVNWMLTIKIPYKESYKAMRNESLLIYTSHILFAKVLLILFPEAHLVVYFVTLALAQGFASLVIHYKEKYPILENLV